MFGSNLSVLRSNVHPNDFRGLDIIKSKFWHHALYVWLQSCHALKRMNGNDDMGVGINEVIWNNEKVKYKNNVLFMRNCIENDITDVKDLFIDGVFITVEQLRARVGPCPGLVLQHNVLLNATPQRCREQAEIWVNPDIDQPLVVPNLGDLRISHLETAAIRKCLVLLRHRHPCCVNF